jgi:hypothetical protein
MKWTRCCRIAINVQIDQFDLTTTLLALFMKAIRREAGPNRERANVQNILSRAELLKINI